MKVKKRIGNFLKFFLIYIAVLCVLAIASLMYVNSLLRSFEASQPERVVEDFILQLKEGAQTGNLETVMPLSDELRSKLNIEKYPDSFSKFILENDLTYSPDIGSYGANSTVYNIECNGKKIARLTLSSTNERTEMIVFTCADWSLDDATAISFEGDFSLPLSITLKVNGEVLDGTMDGSGYKSYSLSLLGDADVELSDIFGNVEKQYGKVRQSFVGNSFTVPSSYTVNAESVDIPSSCITYKAIPEFEYVSEYSAMPMLAIYDIKYIPMKDAVTPQISVFDNVGSKIDYSFGDNLNVTTFKAENEVPSELLEEAEILEFARNWSLFMTNDLAGGLNTISKYLIKDSYLYDVAYKWATGVDRTFTSIHRLYNPPFVDERVTNYVKYSDDCFSCDVYLVKRMRIANGLDVNDELSKKLFFVKYDNTSDGKDNPRWVVADMLGADGVDSSGGEDNE